MLPAQDIYRTRTTPPPRITPDVTEPCYLQVIDVDATNGHWIQVKGDARGLSDPDDPWRIHTPPGVDNTTGALHTDLTENGSRYLYGRMRYIPPQVGFDVSGSIFGTQSGIAKHGFSYALGTLEDFNIGNVSFSPRIFSPIFPPLGAILEDQRNIEGEIDDIKRKHNDAKRPPPENEKGCKCKSINIQISGEAPTPFPEGYGDRKDRQRLGWHQAPGGWGEGRYITYQLRYYVSFTFEGDPSECVTGQLAWVYSVVTAEHQLGHRETLKETALGWRDDTADDWPTGGKVPEHRGGNGHDYIDAPTVAFEYKGREDQDRLDNSVERKWQVDSLNRFFVFCIGSDGERLDLLFYIYARLRLVHTAANGYKLEPLHKDTDLPKAVSA